MSFFPSSSYKPHIRQEGFHLPSPPSSSTPPPLSASSPTSSSSFDANAMFSMPQHNYLSDAFRRQSNGSLTAADLGVSANSAATNAGLSFQDNLAGMMNASNSPHSQDRSTQSPPNVGVGSYHEDQQHRPHNIFDISAPTSHQHHSLHGQHHFQPSSASSTASAFPPHLTGNPNSNMNNNSHDFAPHFNSTLPALNSSMRYEPLPDPPAQPSSAGLSSSFSNQFRHTPSPTISGHHHPVVSHRHHGSTASVTSRSRSRSRPPSTPGGPSSLNTAPVGVTSTNGGPARTTRARRTSSISGTSPPPPARPQAIVIPGAKPHGHGHMGMTGTPISMSNPNANGGGWYPQSGEFSLPTPESLHSHSSPLSHHHHSSSQGNAAAGGDLMGGLGHTPHSLNSLSNSMSNVGLMHHNNPHTSHHGHHIGSPPTPSSFGTQAMSPVSPSSGLGLGALVGVGVGMNGMGLMGTSPMGLPSSAPSGGITPTSASMGMSSPIISHHVPPQSQGSINNSGSQPQSAAEKQAQIANEKRRRRRESHNAVERRRRDNINEKISELATLIPECMLDVNGAITTGSSGQVLSPTDDALLSSPLEAWPAAPPKKFDTSSDDGNKKDDISADQAEATVVKANKGMILRKSVEYIRYLQQLVTAQGARNRELEQELKAYRTGTPSSDSASAGQDRPPGNQKDDAAGVTDLAVKPELASPLPLHNAVKKQSSEIDADEEQDLTMGMVLHDEVDLDLAGLGPSSQQKNHQNNQGQPRRLPSGHGHKRTGSSYSAYGVSLPSMPEGEENEEGDVFEDNDNDPDRDQQKHGRRIENGAPNGEQHHHDFMMGVDGGSTFGGMMVGMPTHHEAHMNGMMSLHHHQQQQLASHDYHLNGLHQQTQNSSAGSVGDLDRMSVGVDEDIEGSTLGDLHSNHPLHSQKEERGRPRSGKSMLGVGKLKQDQHLVHQHNGLADMNGSTLPGAHHLNMTMGLGMAMEMS